MKKKVVKTLKPRRIFFALIIFIFVIFVLYYLGFFTKSCSSEDCFDNAVRLCKPVSFVKYTNNNIYAYTIYRSLGEDCIIHISLKSVAPGSDRDIKDLLEGKSMKCSIPKSLLDNRKLDELENMLNYCHGDLKEGIYELIIKRMYGVVIVNIDEVRNTVKGIL